MTNAEICILGNSSDGEENGLQWPRHKGGPEARREGQKQGQTEVFKCESMSS